MILLLLIMLLAGMTEGVPAEVWGVIPDECATPSGCATPPSSELIGPLPTGGGPIRITAPAPQCTDIRVAYCLGRFRLSPVP